MAKQVSSADSSADPATPSMMAPSPGTARLLPRRAVDRLHAAPVLAARTLPVMGARTEATAATAIRRRAGHELFGELLQHEQAVALFRSALCQAQLDQRALPAHRRPLAQLAGQEFHRGIASLVLFDHAGLCQQRR